MAETAQTMTEFTYAPGEKNIVGDRFSPSVIIFWLKTSIAASSTRVQYRAPNTLFGLIPLGASTKTIPLRNIASVDTNTKFNLGSLVWGLFFLFVGFYSIRNQLVKRIDMIYRVRDGKGFHATEPIHNAMSLPEPNPGMDPDRHQRMNGPDFGI